MSSPPDNLPAWRECLSESLAQSMKENKDAISYCLSTIAPSHPQASISPVPVPQSRFVVHRGFVNERRSPTDGSENPEGPTSSVLLSTTDVRAPKVTQLEGQNKWASIAWWFEPTGDQYRITAKSHVLPPPAEEYSPLRDAFPGAQLAPASLSSSFNWEDERQRIYRKLSPELRASFCRPVPGSPLPPDFDWGALPKELPLPEEAEGKIKEWTQEALKNFALTVFEPVFVDLVCLKADPNTRTQWTRQADGTWGELQVVP